MNETMLKNAITLLFILTAISAIVANYPTYYAMYYYGPSAFFAGVSHLLCYLSSWYQVFVQRSTNNSVLNENHCDTGFTADIPGNIIYDIHQCYAEKT